MKYCYIIKYTHTNIFFAMYTIPSFFIQKKFFLVKSTTGQGFDAFTTEYCDATLDKNLHEELLFTVLNQRGHIHKINLSLAVQTQPTNRVPSISSTLKHISLPPIYSKSYLLLSYTISLASLPRKFISNAFTQS